MEFLTKVIASKVGVLIIVVITSTASAVAAYSLAQAVPTVSEITGSQTPANNSTGDKPNTANGCIVTVAGNKYDVAELRKTHSGGNVFVCNTDMTATFTGQHGTDYARIQKYLVTASGTSSSTGSAAGNADFDATSLAKHNTSGDCYVSYNGIVYDVSNHSQWLSCSHHGVRGGTDITSRFPHSLSYLASLPKVGTYAGPTGGGVNGQPGNYGEDEGEYEYEYEDD